MDPNYQFPTSATYSINKTEHGWELQLVSTLKAFNNHIRQPACKLLEKSTVQQLIALRLTPKVSQSNQDAENRQQNAENRQQMFIVIDNITNYTNDLVRVVTFDVNVDVEPIRMLLKACKGLELMIFNQAQVNRLNKFLLKDAPGHLLPMGHRLKKVVFNRVSFPHVLKMIETLQKTVSKDISPSCHIIEPYLTASDLPVLQNMADSFVNDTWDPSIRFDMVATAAKISESYQLKRVQLSTQINGIVASLRQHMGVVAARNVANRSPVQILATIMKQGPPPLFEVMRDFEQHEAILKEPVEAVRLLSGGALPEPSDHAPEETKKPAAVQVPQATQPQVWDHDPEKEYEVLVNHSMCASLSSQVATPSPELAAVIRKRNKELQENSKQNKKTKTNGTNNKEE